MSTENGLSQQNGNGASVEVAQLQEMRGGQDNARVEAELESLRHALAIMNEQLKENKNEIAELKKPIIEKAKRKLELKIADLQAIIESSKNKIAQTAQNGYQKTVENVQHAGSAIGVARIAVGNGINSPVKNTATYLEKVAKQAELKSEALRDMDPGMIDLIGDRQFSQETLNILKSHGVENVVTLNEYAYQVMEDGVISEKERMILAFIGKLEVTKKDKKEMSKLKFAHGVDIKANEVVAGSAKNIAGALNYAATRDVRDVAGDAFGAAKNKLKNLFGKKK